jgi:hypothetical protein
LRSFLTRAGFCLRVTFSMSPRSTENCRERS